MKKLKLKSYIGYGVADLGNNIAFSVASSYLTLFYIDIIGAHFDDNTAIIWGYAITAIMVIARIWDGINDPIMGYLVQKAKPSKYGKFRHYLLFGGIPLAISAVLMFLPIRNMSLAGCIIFALLTYIAYGMIYTVVLVPYGSLATVMTREQNERSRLSIARSIGGGIGGAPCGILFPTLVYTKYINSKGIEASQLDGTKLVIAMAVIAVIMMISYTISFFTVEEQYPYPNTEQKMNFKATLSTLIHNKPFVIMSLAGMLLIASSMYINTIDLYLFNVYYQKNVFMTFVTIATYAPMIVFVPLSEVIIKKIGKKEMCVYGLILSTVASLIMMCWRIPNPWIYIAFCFLQGSGIAFFTVEVWAMAMDVIDYQELLTHKREEATSYAIFTFMRKIGQAIAAIAPALLSAVDYTSKKGYSGQTEATVNGIYTISTVVPFLMFAIMLVLMILYPLNKKKDQEMRLQLAEIRATYSNEIQTEPSELADEIVIENDENNDVSSNQPDDIDDKITITNSADTIVLDDTENQE